MPATPPAAFVGTGGRLRSERMVAFNRNPWPQSPESAVACVKCNLFKSSFIIAVIADLVTERRKSGNE